MEATKVKHTPGNWKSVSRPDSVSVKSESHGAVCEIPHGGFHREEHEANAKLIAAAPDLLKVLQMCADCLHDGIPIEKGDPIHKTILQHIIKATE